MGREDYEDEEWKEMCNMFAEPGGKSSLRRAHKGNARTKTCPDCGAQNVLTVEDIAHGYRCNMCADRAEMGLEY